MHIIEDQFEAAGPAWNTVISGGPVTATAIHAGHIVRSELEPHLAIDEEGRRREEDPLTDFFLNLADNVVRVNRSRFECDVNRPRDKCISDDPEDTWGLKIWKDDLPDLLKENSRKLHDRFYTEMRAMFDDLLEQHKHILVLDLHSYNHMRDGPDAPPAPEKDNPDIDIGATTLDKGVFGDVLSALSNGLTRVPVRGRKPQVAENIRYPDGGNFPEWLHEIYPDRACVITLEYKKIFMNEWTGTLDIGAVQDLRTGLMHALGAAREQLARLEG
ncbi:N-formylglutamate amidohydrolase [Erythrobacter sp.]|uniref:N-formylglutamate amidohydrolase n=1 Tax=Erythrobacter sp. TaxID=1042 RepID=UPI002EA7A2E6|nr:N-formylglutamate amidohydrolase [Erythrobacter sp.]